MRNNHMWRFIASNRIRVDLSGCRYAEDLHVVLKDAFGFPEDYGGNWSAFWDYLDDFCGDRTSKTTIQLEGLYHLSKELRNYTEKMIEITKRAEEKYPQISVVINE